MKFLSTLNKNPFQLYKKLMHHSNQIFALFVLFFCSAEIQADDDFSLKLPQIKESVVAVGTFNPNHSPKAKFRGTGFAIGDGGLIVTNNHVLPISLMTQQNERLAVFLNHQNKNEMIFATEIIRDETHDLAILKLEGEKLPALKIGNSQEVKEGEIYAFTGYPLGIILGAYPVTHRAGISAISPDIIPVIKSAQLDAKLIKRLQTPSLVFQLDATAYPGNSGSPLYHMKSGAVIGIINKVFVQEGKESALTKPSGITYAIPSEHLYSLLKTNNLL